MTPEQFRQHGHEVVDWIADYWARIGSFPVRSQVSPGEVRAAPAGHRAGAGRAVLRRPRRPRPGRHAGRHALAAPRLLRLLPRQHVRPVGARRPGLRRSRRPGHVVGDQPGGHRARAARPRLVRRPPGPARLVPLHRHRRRRGAGLQLRRQPRRAAGRAAPAPAAAPPSATASSPSGPPSTSPRRPTPPWRRPSASPGSAATPSASWRSTATSPCAPAPSRPGWSATSPAATRPVLVCATVGTTSTTAVDPLAELGPICQKYGVWLHVDAAYAGVSAVVPELRGAAGRRRVGRQLHHRRAQVAAHRLRRDALLGRRPRRADRRAGDPAGVPAQRRHRRRRRRRLPRLADPARPPVPGAQAVVRAPLVRRRGTARPHPRARRPRPGAGRLGRRPTSGSTSSRRTRSRWSACAPRWPDEVDADVATMTLLERLNDGGEVFLTHTTVGGQAVLRVAIGAPPTTRAHVERVWTLLREAHDWLAADFAAAGRRAGGRRGRRAAARGGRAPASASGRGRAAEPSRRRAGGDRRRPPPVERPARAAGRD